MAEMLSVGLVVILLSEMVALRLIWKLWCSGDHLFFKISLSCIALLPVLGPLLLVWISNFPSRVPYQFRDNYRYSTDVFDRWRHVFADKNPVRRFRNWRAIAESDSEDWKP